MWSNETWDRARSKPIVITPPIPETPTTAMSRKRKISRNGMGVGGAGSAEKFWLAPPFRSTSKARWLQYRRSDRTLTVAS